MAGSPLLKVCYALTTLYGIVTMLAPKRALSASLKLWSVGLENVSELEPRPWYVRHTRAVGAGMVVAGVVGCLLQRRVDDVDAVEEPEIIETDA
ncbi:hypothetical protein [Natrarchaeobaculum sulfurireducens]|uniref:DUF6199 domain-containing protein n=1 Tax=Natrarchaeobaculum sulfurireducens TaxID=2044521 RepID=A0A346PIA9_9EURY|nr:hypothetical protein [Natrarchaeobaculum sulfurireducens]AXR79254.1 hypothetical protein AArc1_2946 [Natrarchaeobaculum sulfurireducens]AXR80668.1 hypothetical protein AArcMg_0645 [Natrarchaeobaculum sulfurireducens]